MKRHLEYFLTYGRRRRRRCVWRFAVDAKRLDDSQPTLDYHIDILLLYMYSTKAALKRHGDILLRGIEMISD